MSGARAQDSAAPAQDTPPTREIVVTATRVPTPVLDIPAGVSVIDRQTIEERGYTTLTDALSAVPGVRVSQSGGPGGNASVFVRGTNSNAVLVLRDGMPLNDASDASGAFNFGVDTLADVERIEIIRGPMAALYGSGAIGGVINLISRRATNLASTSPANSPEATRSRWRATSTPPASKGRSTTRPPCRGRRSAATTPRRSARRSTPASPIRSAN